MFYETIICEKDCLEEIDDDHCISQLIRGTHANCDYQFNQNQIIETLNDNTIFLNNFNGEVYGNNTSKHLEGNFLIQYNNETITINNMTFTNQETHTSQILPSVLQSNITEKGMKLNPEYLHNLHLNNVEKLQELFSNHEKSGLIDFGIIVLILTIISVFAITRRHHYYKIRHQKAAQQQIFSCLPEVHTVTLNT